MRVPGVLWALKAMTAVHLPVHLRGPGGVSALSASAGVIFIPTGRRLVRPMVTNSKTRAVCSGACRRVMTDVLLGPRRTSFETAVMTVDPHHQKLDLPEGSGVFAMAANRCVFS